MPASDEVISIVDGSHLAVVDGKVRLSRNHKGMQHFSHPIPNCSLLSQSIVARTLGLSMGAARQAVRRLDELGALRVLKRNKTGHFVEMRLPEKIRAIGWRKNGALAATGTAGEPPAATPEATDFLKTWALRKAIHDREGGACFYCLRRTPANVRCLDHVVPRVWFGRNSYRNLVSCCVECNTRKGDKPDPDFLRILYRKGRLTSAELDAGLGKLKDLAAGKLRPAASGLNDAR